MAAKPAVPFLARSALTLAALALLGGCAQYSDADACADLSTMVWPWQGLESPGQVATVPLPDVPQIATFPAYAVRVSGALDRPADTTVAGSQPEAVFQCEHHGDLLHSFGWVEPDMLARPELRINRAMSAPTN
jgi:hypothetical protein